ncbi:MAG: AAA family ATPase [Deltaproteobacteria bacterium]|nr:AAA family ATPase [Deltaproteobacteria bacterium]
MRSGLAPGQPTQPGDSSQLAVYLLGRFEVSVGARPLPPNAWRRRRPADLLKLVALAEGRQVAREQVVEALWPGKDPASGANNLHRALYDLRQVLGARAVELERGLVQLRPEVWLDVDAFEAAARRQGPGAAEAAVALYRGWLCPEDGDEPWIVPRRAALAALFAGVAGPAARAAAERGEAGKAIALLRRAADAAPLDEGLHRELTRLLAAAGRRVEAARQLERCRTLLLGAGRTPDPATADLESLLAAGGTALPAGGSYDGARRVARRLLGSADPPPLRGRGDVLGAVGALVEAGRGGLVLLGEPGVGKTRLAVEAARLAQARGALVLGGVPRDGGPVPYGPFLDAFADLERSGGAASSDPFADRGAGLGLEAEKLRLFGQVRAALQGASGGRRVFLLLDDLALVDESSANLLHFLLREQGELALTVVGTCREGAVRSGQPVHTLLAHLDAERLARGVRVQRLDLAATRDQAADLLGLSPGEPVVERIYRISDGNPFHTEELVRAWRAAGRLPAALDVGAVIRERAEALGPDCGDVLAAAAASGRRFEVALAQAVSGLPEPRFRAALDRCLEAQLLDEDNAGCQFRHQLVREALHALLPLPRRAALHRAVADVLEARAASDPALLERLAQELAAHRRAGEQPGRAARLLIASGHRAAARAGLAEALSCYQQAVEMADAAGLSGEERLELREAQAAVQLADADLPGLARTAEALGSMAVGPWRPPPERRVRARRLAALGLVSAGRLAEARAQLEAGLAEGAAQASEERPELLHLLAQVEWHLLRFPEAAAAAERCAAEAQASGDPALSGRGLDVAALARAAMGELAQPGEPPEPSEGGPDQPFESQLLLFQRDLIGDGPLGEVERLAALFSGRAALRRSANSQALGRAVQGVLSFLGGALLPAETALREAAARHASAGSALGESFAREQLGLLLSAAGRHAEARVALADAVVAAERAALRRHALLRAHASLGAALLAAGARGEAGHALHEAEDLATRHGECVLCDAAYRPAAAALALALGRLEEAGAEAARLDVVAGNHGGLGLLAAARRTRGRVLAAQGRLAEARSAIGEAARALEQLGAHLPAAQARLEEAQVLARQGGAAEADRLGGLARSRLRAMGIDADPEPALPGPDAGWR